MTLYLWDLLLYIIYAVIPHLSNLYQITGLILRAFSLVTLHGAKLFPMDNTIETPYYKVAIQATNEVSSIL